MAHTKQGGSSKLGRDSKSKRLGVKRQNGELVRSGEIIIRQRGTKYRPGRNVKLGVDDTIYAVASGSVKFETKSLFHFNGQRRRSTIVSIVNKF